MMASNKNREIKKRKIDNFASDISGKNFVMIIYYSGINVEDMSKLRSEVRGVGGSMLVMKNKLAKLAFQDTNLSEVSSLMKGPTAIAYAEDHVFVKKIVEFGKTNESLKIVGGFAQDKLVSAKEIEAIALWPTLDEARARILGVLQAVPAQIARVIDARVKKEA